MLAKTKMLGLTLATVVGFSLPTMVWAENGNMKPMHKMMVSHQECNWHHGGQENLTAKILNLSDSQVKQLKENRQKQKETMKSLFEKVRANRKEFETEIVKAAPDMSKLNDIQIRLKSLQSKMVDNHLNAILAIKKILTPEQFAGWMALEKEEDLTRHDRFMMFGRKDEACKMDYGHKHGWGKPGRDRDSDEQE